jgi:hypothetical protein
MKRIKLKSMTAFEMSNSCWDYIYYVNWPSIMQYVYSSIIEMVKLLDEALAIGVCSRFINTSAPSPYIPTLSTHHIPHTVIL